MLRCKASTWDVVPICWSRVADWTPLSRAAQLLDPSGVLWALTLASMGAPRSCSEQNGGKALLLGAPGCSETVLSFRTKGSVDVKENASPNFLVYSWWVTSLPFTLQRVPFSGASEKAHC